MNIFKLIQQKKNLIGYNFPKRLSHRLLQTFDHCRPMYSMLVLFFKITLTGKLKKKTSVDFILPQIITKTK